MSIIKPLLGFVCAAASAGAETTMNEMKDLMEVVALLFSHVQEGLVANSNAPALNANAPAVVAEIATEASVAEAATIGWYVRLGAFTDTIFAPIFHPMNRFLANIYEPWAQIVVVVYFVATWIWVAFILKKEYVNLSCPYKTRMADLRFWTLIAMLPTLIVYLYFQ